MADSLHIVCPHCHTTNRVRQEDLSKAPDCGSCHKMLFTRHPGGRVNAPPTEGGLYLGHVRIDGRTRATTVTHRDLAGAELDRRELAPRA